MYLSLISGLACSGNCSLQRHDQIQFRLWSQFKQLNQWSWMIIKRASLSSSATSKLLVFRLRLDLFFFLTLRLGLCIYDLLMKQLMETEIMAFDPYTDGTQLEDCSQWQIDYYSRLGLWISISSVLVIKSSWWRHNICFLVSERRGFRKWVQAISMGSLMLVHVQL